MKEFKDMPFNERVSWACGHLLIAIGEGRFREGVALVLTNVRLPANRNDAALEALQLVRALDVFWKAGLTDLSPYSMALSEDDQTVVDQVREIVRKADA